MSSDFLTGARFGSQGAPDRRFARQSCIRDAQPDSLSLVPPEPAAKKFASPVGPAATWSAGPAAGTAGEAG
jgi:hypothetical protein